MKAYEMTLVRKNDDRTVKIGDRRQMSIDVGFKYLKIISSREVRNRTGEKIKC